MQTIALVLGIFVLAAISLGIVLYLSLIAVGVVVAIIEWRRARRWAKKYETEELEDER